MAALTTQDVTPLAGTVITYTAATAADTAECDNTLIVRNGSGVSTTVTITTPGAVSGLAIADQPVTVNAGQDKAIPLPSSLYKDPADNRAHFTTSPTASITLAVISAKA